MRCNTSQVEYAHRLPRKDSFADVKERHACDRAKTRLDGFVELSMLSTVLSMLRIESDFMSRRLNACMASELALSPA